MPMSATSSGAQRDLRIDFFRGLALLFIFVDHVPDNVLAKFTLKNFGFADAAEVFVLLAGFSAVLAYQRVFEGQGFKAGVARVFERVRDIYLWHLALVVICGLGLTLAATQFGNISYVTNIGVHVFTENPARSSMLAAVARQPAELTQHPAAVRRAADVLAPVRVVVAAPQSVAGAGAVGRLVGGFELAHRELAEHAACRTAGCSTHSPGSC